MASPFKVFRKNQKAALAVLTVVAMGGFVVLPTVSQLVGGGGSAAAARQPVVTTVRYGDVDAATMSRMRGDRQVVVRFLSEVDQIVRTRQQNWRTPTVAGQIANAMSIEDQAIIQTWLLVNHADELGIVVDDAAVNDFITEIAQGSLTQEDLTGVGNNQGLLGAMGVSENQLFRLLKYELVALRVQRLAMSGLQATTPGQRWDLYKRLNRSMRVELAEVPVQRFVDSVSDPDSATLERFFDKYKDRENNPASPEPGFRVPKRIAVEYFKVNDDQLFEPGELEKYYEEHKEEFKRESLPDAGPTESAPELKGSLPGLDGPPIDLPPAGDAPNEMEASAEETKSEQPAPAETAEAPKQDEEQPKPVENGSQDEKKKNAAEKPNDAPKPSDESRRAGRSLFQLTSYPAEDKPDAEPAEQEPEEAKTEVPKEPEKAESEEPKKAEPEEPKKSEPEKPETAEPEKAEPAEDKPTESSDQAEQPKEEGASKETSNETPPPMSIDSEGEAPPSQRKIRPYLRRPPNTTPSMKSNRRFRANWLRRRSRRSSSRSRTR